MSERFVLLHGVKIICTLKALRPILCICLSYHGDEMMLFLLEFLPHDIEKPRKMRYHEEMEKVGFIF